MNVPNEWMDTLGARSRVFVLDSGWNPRCGTVEPVEAKNFTPRPMSWECRHGQTVADIIANRVPTDQGVAPECNLYIAKVWDSVTTRWVQYERALIWALEQGADVVNMSFASREISPGMRYLLRELDKAGTICCAAYAGRQWPAASPHVLPVGPAGVQLPKGVLRVGEIRKRLGAGLLEPATQASYATAVVSGVAACAKAWDSGFNRQSLLRSWGGTPA